MISSIGKIFILIGVIFLVLGLLFTFFKQIPYLGKLPGDILIQKKNFTFYFPIATSVLLSSILSLVCFFLTKNSNFSYAN